ncbi:MAG: SPFH domain-containing protein, partial [Chlamydiae bacterium]|nr:SPFH domain-containing protein [Chlamydiota bacterium]
MMFIPGFFTVPQNHVAIKERFGQYREVLGPGLHFVNPFLDSLKDFSTWEGTAVKCSRLGSCYLLEQSEQQLETNFRTCHTKDKVPIQATSVIYFRIADPVKAAYVVDILPLTLQETCSHVMRSAIGSYDFDDLFSKRTEISKKVTSELMGKTQAWGISLSEVNIGQLQYDEEINKALQTKRIAEATKATKMIEAETAAI